MLSLTRPALRLAVHARLVSCGTTYSRSAVTAEVASSSLVVPATHQTTCMDSDESQREVQKETSRRLLCTLFPPGPNSSPRLTSCGALNYLVGAASRGRTSRSTFSAIASS